MTTACDLLFMSWGGGIKQYLCKHGLPVLGDHGALVTVQGDAGVVERLLGVFEDVVQLGDAALEHCAEVAGDQRPADGCRERENKAGGFNTRNPNAALMDQSRRGAASVSASVWTESQANAAQFMQRIVRGYFKVRRS